MADKKDIFDSSRKLRRRRMIWKAVFWAVTVVFICSAIVSLFYIPYFRIKRISVEGNSTIKTDDITQKVFGYLDGKYFWLIPKDNIFTVSKSEMVSSLSDTFSRVKNVEIDRNFPDGLSVSVSERETAGLWCRSELESYKVESKKSGSENCSFVDTNGFVFEKAPYFSGDVFLKFFDNRTGAEDGLRFQGIEESQFSKFMQFKNLLAKENIKISKIILKDENIYEFHTSESWFILLNKENNPELSFENLKLVLTSKIKDQRNNLEYIDLRFGNKISYKVK